MPPSESQPQSEDESRTFESRVGELQEIVSQMEGGTLGLDDAMTKFERGVELLRTCFQTLEAAEARIEILTGADGDGRPVSRPFEASPRSPQNSPQSRSSDVKAPPTQQSGAADTGEGDLLF